MVTLSDVVNEAKRDTVSKTLFAYAGQYDREALEKLQLAYLSAFEQAALNTIYLTPSETREVVVPAGDLRFAVKLSSTSPFFGSYYFAIENDLNARWLLVISETGDRYVARLTPDTIVWTWYFFNRQISGTTLEMYAFDAIIVSPVSIAAEVMLDGNSSTPVTTTISSRQVQGLSFGTAYQTSSTVTRSLPSLVEEVIDFLLQQWYVVIASVKGELLRDIERRMDAVEQRRNETKQLIQQLGRALQISVNVTKSTIQTGTDLVFEWSTSASNLTLEQALETELYEQQLRELYTAIQEVDVRAAIAGTSDAITSIRNNAVNFFQKYGTDTLISAVTLATMKATERNSADITRFGKSVVFGTWALGNQIISFIKGKIQSNIITWVVQLWSWLKSMQPNDLSEILPIIAKNLQPANPPSAIVLHDILNPPSLNYKVLIGTFIVNLVVVDNFIGNGYFAGVYNRNAAMKDAVEMTIATALPAVPAALVYFGTSMFLTVGPAAALTGSTYALALLYTLYQKSNEETKKNVDKALNEALTKSAEVLPKIPEAVGRVIDNAGSGLMIAAIGYILLSYRPTLTPQVNNKRKRK